MLWAAAALTTAGITYAALHILGAL
jgi:hypothetical protein